MHKIIRGQIIQRIWPCKKVICKHLCQQLYTPRPYGTYIPIKITSFIQSYRLCHEYQMEGNQYSWLLFHSEDRFWANLHIQEQLIIWHHNTCTSCSCDITDPLLWQNNAKSGKTALGNNGEMDDQWLFLVECVCSGHEIPCKNYNNVVVTCEVIWQLFLLVTSSLIKIIEALPSSWQKLIIYSNQYIILYISVILKCIHMPTNNQMHDVIISLKYYLW